MGATAQFSGVEAMRQNPLLLTPEAGFVAAEMPGLWKAAILMIADWGRAGEDVVSEFV